MSKLFNIQDGGKYDEMVGGVYLKDASDDDIDKMVEAVGIDSINSMKDDTTIKNSVDIETIKKINTIEDAKKFFKDNKDKGDAKYLFSKINDKINSVGTATPEETVAPAQGITVAPSTGTSEAPAQEPTTKVATPDGTSTQGEGTATPAPKEQPPPPLKCIHIGIIDELGTFVGVKNINENDPELFKKLKTISDELKQTNGQKNEEAQKDPVAATATIYDKFLYIKDNCDANFIEGYETKFFNSAELKTLYEKTNKENVQFTLKSSSNPTDVAITDGTKPADADNTNPPVSTTVSDANSTNQDSTSTEKKDETRPRSSIVTDPPNSDTTAPPEEKKTEETKA